MIDNVDYVVINRNAVKKENLTQIVIDNFEARYLSDEVTERYIRNAMEKYDVAKVWMINKNAKLVPIMR